jgi:hypothetical protein
MHTLPFALVLLVLSGEAAAAQDPILFRRGDKTIFDGRFGALFRAQASIDSALVACGSTPIGSDGRFGNATRDGVRRLVACPGFAERIAEDSAAREGAITQSLWEALPGAGPPPGVAERAMSLVLTYEATDYGDLEWNFCQNGAWSPGPPEKPCRTNDPGSFITWGPRGATAGGGREVQWVLWRIERSHPALIDAAFGAEAPAVRSLLSADKASTRSALCAIYLDPARRAAWTRAFAELGGNPSVRTAYDAHYDSDRSDGSKMARFAATYAELGLAPTEVDYAFFLDRATHSSGLRVDAAAAAAAIRSWLAQRGWTLAPANVRRAISGRYPTRNQTADRLGRDVAFFVDAVGVDNLTATERSAWRKRGPLRASDVGLSDARPGPPIAPTDAGAGPGSGSALTPLPACPASVLDPLPPLPR